MVKGGDIANVLSRMDYDDAIDFVIRFVNSQTGLDVREYIANVLALDYIILNTDRHMNNLGVIFDGTDFREAPIFDNGKSMFVGVKEITDSDTLDIKIKKCYAKGFSASYELNYNYLKNYVTFQSDKKAIIDALYKENISQGKIELVITRLEQL